MKILFDFLTLHYKNGAAEYTRRVFYALLDKIVEKKLTGVRIFCLYDSLALPLYEDLSPDVLRHEQVQFVDAQIGAMAINRMEFDVFFLACAHSGGWHSEISEYKCKSIIVVHDCVWEEMYKNDISIYLSLNGNDHFRYREYGPQGKKIYWNIKSPTIRFCRWLLYAREHGLYEMNSRMLEERGWNIPKAQSSIKRFMICSSSGKSAIQLIYLSAKSGYSLHSELLKRREISSLNL